MADQIVQILPDSTGKKVDVSEVTRLDGTVVERQRMNISDPDNTNLHAEVKHRAISIASDQLTELIALIKTTNELLEEIRERL